jgi:branched-subunit amino acid ABC-type transport system permease component
MSTLLPFLVIGVTTGSVYALSALGLTLTYRTTGIFNFALGAIGSASAYIFYDLTTNAHLSWPVAAAICVLGLGTFAGLGLERLGHVLVRVDVPVRIVATVGLMVAINALIIVRYGAGSLTFPTFLPTNLHSIIGTEVPSSEIITVVLVLAVTVALTLVLKFTRFGSSTRAVVDDPELLALTGTNPDRVRRASWVLGTTFAAAAGILAASSLGTLDPTLLTLLLIDAIGAAAIGAFQSVTLTYVGGLAIGVIAALATKYIAGGSGLLAGLPSSVPIIVLLLALVVVPRDRLLSRTRTIVQTATSRVRAKAPLRRELVGIVAFFVLAAFAPNILGGARVLALTGTAVYAILFLSLALLVNLAGQISLCQFGLAAIGAATFSKLAASAGVPWVPALILAGLMAVPVGAVVALVAVRLSGLFLALATLATGVLLEGMFYGTNLMFTQQQSIPSPRPSFAQGDLAYYHVTVVALGLCTALVIWVERGQLGRLLRGLSESPTTMTAHGTDVRVTKLLVFCLSAFIAGIAGALYGPIAGSVNAVPFDPLNSLTMLALLVMAGYGLLRPAVLGGLALSLIPSYITDATVVNYLPVLYGVSAATVAVLTARGGNPAIVGDRLRRALRLRQPRLAATPTIDEPSVVKEPTR